MPNVGLVEWWMRLHAIVTGEDDFPDPSETISKFADLIDPIPVTGDTSDGYHTFNELYHHRAVLFSVVVAAFPDKAWKSKAHHDGTMYDHMFIVGIGTPEGQATYHYDINPYWDMFHCKVLDCAPEWDGHTPEQAIERIGKLVDFINRPTCRIVHDKNRDCDMCTNCSTAFELAEFDYADARACEGYSYCPKCGAEVER